MNNNHPILDGLLLSAIIIQYWMKMFGLAPLIPTRCYRHNKDQLENFQSNPPGFEYLYKTLRTLFYYFKD